MSADVVTTVLIVAALAAIFLIAVALDSRADERDRAEREGRCRK